MAGALLRFRRVGIRENKDWTTKYHEPRGISFNRCDKRARETKRKGEEEEEEEGEEEEEEGSLTRYNTQ